jgi:hypothetical protein
VPQAPTLLGGTDAAKHGMGGVYFDGASNAFVWREPSPHAVQRRLVSHNNPTGDVTNSDLEHAGLLAQVDLMTETHDVCYATPRKIFCKTLYMAGGRAGCPQNPWRFRLSIAIADPPIFCVAPRLGGCRIRWEVLSS